MSEQESGGAVGSLQGALEERRQRAEELALEEIRDLKKDLGALEKALKGSGRAKDVPLYDILHGAMEVFRNAAAALEARDLSAELFAQFGRALSVENLERHDASLLKKPAGWHWISPDGEMHFLAGAREPEKAWDKLQALLRKKANSSAGGKKTSGSKKSTGSGAADAGEKAAGRAEAAPEARAPATARAKAAKANTPAGKLSGDPATGKSASGKKVFAKKMVGKTAAGKPAADTSDTDGPDADALSCD